MEYEAYPRGKVVRKKKLIEGKKVKVYKYVPDERDRVGFVGAEPFPEMRRYFAMIRNEQGEACYVDEIVDVKSDSENELMAKRKIGGKTVFVGKKIFVSNKNPEFLFVKDLEK